jgi:DNA-directed RNA polymerase subunit beta'
MLNPIMEEPIRTVLGLRRQDLQDLLAGRTSYDGKSGAEGLRTLLSRLDLGTLKKQALDTVRSGARSKRDAAVRQYQYLSAFQSEGKRPEDFIWERVPVLPPKYRPIHKVGRLNVVSDPNYLYKAVLDSITDFNDTQKEKLPPNEVKAARANVYSSLRALVGVADPVQPELVEKGVGGILEQITGRGSPKGSFVQRRLIGANIDVSGMGVITPDPNLRLNQVGLPESLAWNLYEPFIVRDLVRHGWQATDAAKAVAQKAPGALNALQRVVKERPVIYNRAPTLHKYSILGAWPVLTKGDTFRIHPAVVKPFGADFDGDVMSFSVPVSKAAVDEVVSKMMPEKLLLGERQDQPNFVPGNEYLLGLYLASKAPAQKTVRRFPSRQAAVQAYRDGKLRIDDPIEIG